MLKLLARPQDRQYQWSLFLKQLIQTDLIIRTMQYLLSIGRMQFLQHFSTLNILCERPNEASLMQV